jgi:phage gpG-like protein
MTLDEFQGKLNKWSAEFSSSVFPTIQTSLGKTLLQHFTDNFKAGGYEKGTSFVPWAERKYSYNHKPLQKTGNLLAGYRVMYRMLGISMKAQAN